MSLFLGIDGGGTKTAFVLVDSAGVVLARAQRPSSDYYRLGIQAVAHTLADGVSEICRKSGADAGEITFTVVGMPGYGEVSADVPVLDAAPLTALGHSRYLCVNDMVCGWAGSLGATDGINVVGGTGSMTYGERHGVGARVGGWGELFGDEGSGYWIATKGLNAFTRMSDGRLERGPLYELVKERVGVEHDLDAIGVVFAEWQRDRTRIAALARTVADAAGAGDVVAAGILDAAGREFTQLVEATRSALHFRQEEAVPVSYSGGVFKSEAVLGAFSQALAQSYHGYDLRTPRYQPDVGAALYAAKVSGNPFTEDALGLLATS